MTGADESVVEAVPQLEPWLPTSFAITLVGEARRYSQVAFGTSLLCGVGAKIIGRTTQAVSRQVSAARH